jgi:hypothetical protein
VAFATGPNEIALLMRDLTGDLLPDVREPLAQEQERRLLGSLARLHAHFWDWNPSDSDWLVQPGQYGDLLGPAITDDPGALSVLSPALGSDVTLGWTTVNARLPDVSRLLARPGALWEREWADLPRTLLHGDSKVANFALVPDGRVAAFDWAMIGHGPCTIDLGWYLAVNAPRLTGPKEQVILRYRTCLEDALGRRLPAPIWKRLEDVAVVSGARMLLWSKALGLERGRPGAREEWDWWVGRLGAGLA